ncbi:STAS domain-containing protein [Streptomyces sp. NEAU-Y11]|uniref:STAS domain-containing protein n=1 Tax=Streptomyces cucumeris TaxID=2962890 RepID=UPI0020C84341|nr:STAS domain-containing protein [Streptomyces sp. NEAU-Y11]MCP9210719.1 STAS domain-containing protein [Streptomyces sp. NEAU-Y11]
MSTTEHHNRRWMLAGPENTPMRRAGGGEPPEVTPVPPRRPPVVLVLDGPVGRAEVPRLCERLGELAHGGGPGPVTVDVAAVSRPDLAVVEALARLRLTARRLGRGMRLRNAGGGLRELLVWAGLEETLSDGPKGTHGPAAPDPGDGLRVDAPGESEEREQGLGVQEGVEPRDPPV